MNDAVSLSNNFSLISDTGTGNTYKVTFNGASISYSTLITAPELNRNGVNGIDFDKLTNMLYLVTSTFGSTVTQGHVYEVKIDNSFNVAGNIEQQSSEILGNGNLDDVIARNGRVMQTNQVYLCSTSILVLTFTKSVEISNRQQS